MTRQFMMRPSPVTFFKQSLKSESYYADELINIYFLRPLAAIIVWLVYPTSITPNHITLLAILTGLGAAWLYSFNTPSSIAIGGLLVTLKDILDDADGQLGRAKQRYSRLGRFLDSVGDFVVDVALFGAITYIVFQSAPTALTVILGILAFWGITLRVSYHVFYQVSFLHLEERYKLNRITEEITDEDRKGDQVALRLQQVFLLLYGWQDGLMYRLDEWCRKGLSDEERLGKWYSDRAGLRLSGFLGFGTELALLTLCSLMSALHEYLYLNVILMNGIWLVSVLYRRFFLAPGIRRS